MMAWCYTRSGQVLKHCRQLLSMWLAKMGLSLNEAKSSIHHTLEGKQPGFAFLGFAIRQYRVGTHQSGKGPRGSRRLGFKTLIKPCQDECEGATWRSLGGSYDAGRPCLRGSGSASPPTIWGWAPYYRTGVSQAVYNRLDHFTWDHAPQLGTLATPTAIHRLGDEAVLA